jgi:hypothetical protein
LHRYVEVLHADGNTSRRAAGARGWVGTNLAGTRWAQADAFEKVPEPEPAAAAPAAAEGGDGEGGDDAKDAGDAPAEPEADAEAPAEEGAEGGAPEEAAPEEEVPPAGPVMVTPAATFVEGVPSATVVDPDTGATVTTREDLTMVVTHPAAVAGAGGRHLVVHSDGTRVCSSPDEAGRGTSPERS